MNKLQRGSGSRLRRHAPLIVVLAVLCGCQANQADNPIAPRESVSLFGVRIGMTPDQLNVALPGAHCAPTTEHPICRVPSTAMDSSGINVQFSNGQVISAYAEGAMGGGIRNVSRIIAEQLGPSQERPFDDTYASTWVAKDESELALLQGHYINPEGYGYPADYTLMLSSPISRKQRAQERAEAAQKIERDLTNTLGQFFAIDSAGHVSICDIHVGTAFDGKLGCPPSANAELLAGSGVGSCNNMLGPHFSVDPLSAKRGLALRAPTAKICVSVTTDATTRQVTSVSATFARDATDWRTVDSALVALPNASQLKRSPDDLIIDPAWHYGNAIGDVVTFKMDEDKFALGKPLGESRKVLTVSIAGKNAEASFN